MLYNIRDNKVLFEERAFKNTADELRGVGCIFCIMTLYTVSLKLFFVAGDPSVITGKLHMPYRTDVINHLSADRTSLLSGKIAVVTLL